MKRLFLIFLLLFGCSHFSLEDTAGPPCIPMSKTPVVDYITTGDNEVAIPSTGVITEAMCKNGVLNDSALTADTDIDLPDLEYETSFIFFIRIGTYTASWVPPSGEQLVLINSAITADYEADTSKDVYDEFVFQRREITTGVFRWIIKPVVGIVANGGVAD